MLQWAYIRKKYKRVGLVQNSHHHNKKKRKCSRNTLLTLRQIITNHKHNYIFFLSSMYTKHKRRSPGEFSFRFHCIRSRIYYSNLGIYHLAQMWASNFLLCFWQFCCCFCFAEIIIVAIAINVDNPLPLCNIHVLWTIS